MSKESVCRTIQSLPMRTTHLNMADTLIVRGEDLVREVEGPVAGHQWALGEGMCCFVC